MKAINSSKVIAIGALGGSGTRAVAKIFMAAGVFMGDDLNLPNDNLTFTRLFKNPNWYHNATNSEVNQRLRIFEKHMTGDTLNLNEKREFQKAAKSNYIFPSDKKYISSILYSTKSVFAKKRTTWGWKEPNTQIFIEEIANYFPNIKYIHVLRHGLDMAFSKNLQQLKNWGQLFNIELLENDTENQIAQKQLDYWIKSNKSTIRKASNLLKDNFHILNLHNFCKDPKEEIKKLLNFTDIDFDENLISRLQKIPQKQDSDNRYKNKDISIFTNEELAAVKNLGFHI